MRTLIHHGRQHHGERLSSIYYLLQEAGEEVRWITENNSVNLDPHTEDIRRAGWPYLHLEDYLSAGEKKAAHAEAVSILARMCGGILDTVAPFWVLQGVLEACENLQGWRRAFEAERPDLFLALHMNNFFARTGGYMAHEMGIPVGVFQEGLLRHRDQKTMGKQAMAADYASFMFVWSESARQAYIEAGIAEQILHVSGMAHLDGLVRLRIQEPERWRDFVRQKLGIPPQARLVTFCLPMPGRYEGDAVEAIKTVVQWAGRMGLLLILKLHPFDEVAESGLGAMLAGEQHVRVYRREPAQPMLAVSDMVLVQHSTTAIEALAFGTPVVEVDFDRVGILQSMADDGVALQVFDEKGLTAALEWSPDRTILKAWQEYHVGPLDGRATERIVRELRGFA